MPSAYSNLKIQLMATGENDTTWGAVTNLNLGTALEEAIVGSADVTFASADVNLTLTNSNATQVARNLRLNLVGTSGGARNLYLSTDANIQKLYIINNGLADAVTVRNKITGTPSGASITVPAGKTMFVYNTGTNIVETINSVETLNVVGALSGTTGSFSGDVTFPTQAPGDNTTKAATTAFVSAATSALGTMSTQNANNVNITGGTITGITDLAVADGGTGASTLAANAVLLGNNTSAIQTVAPGSSGNVLTSDGTTWASSAPSISQSSFTGSNQSLSSKGYQKLPGGLIIQWGAIPINQSISVYTSISLSSAANFAIEFPTAVLSVSLQFHRTGGTSRGTTFDLTGYNTSGITSIYGSDTGTSGTRTGSIFYTAIGY